jgi:hypothetical protein
VDRSRRSSAEEHGGEGRQVGVVAGLTREERGTGRGSCDRTVGVKRVVDDPGPCRL